MDIKKFTYEEMQEYLPDYIFGRLAPEERQRFEDTLTDFPDLQKEIAEVQKVFRKLESMDFENYVERKTKNIPVKVTNRLQQKRQPLVFLSSRGFRTAVASLGLLIILLSLIFMPKQRNSLPINPKTEEKQTAKLQNEEPLIKIEGMEELVSSVPNANDLNGASVVVAPSIFESFSKNSEIATALDSLMKETLVSSLNTNSQISIDLVSYSQLINNLNQLDESDFIELIEELQNVNI